MAASRPAGSVSTATAPAAAASAQNLAPWCLLPGSAAYRSPGRTRRESWVIPVTPRPGCGDGAWPGPRRAGCLYAKEHRESRERARGNLAWAKIRWHGLRVPPFTAR